MIDGVVVVVGILSLKGKERSLVQKAVQIDGLLEEELNQDSFYFSLWKISYISNYSSFNQ